MLQKVPVEGLLADLPVPLFRVCVHTTFAWRVAGKEWKGAGKTSVVERELTEPNLSDNRQSWSSCSEVFTYNPFPLSYCTADFILAISFSTELFVSDTTMLGLQNSS